MKGDCYPELVSVFYNNLKVVNDDIHSRVKGMDIIINDNVWIRVAGLKDEGCMSHLYDSMHNRRTTKRHMYKGYMRFPGRYRKEKGYLHKGLDREENMIAYILDRVLLPGRYIHYKLTLEDLYLLNAIQFRIPTNWVVVFKKHMINIGVNDEHNMPYGVFISNILKLNHVVLIGETKVICNKTNEIGKAILTCIRLKKTTLGCIFSDDQTQTRDKDELSDSENDHVSFSPKSKFERFVTNKSKKSFGKTNKMKRLVKRMERKMEEIIKNYVKSFTSTEESDENDKSSEEDSMEISNSD
ncbi:hypothetical protein LR48_Vigan02g117300 [Vigna angularis]|uniref:Uncharacterized protein n=1 Tax=Phaseolus angularis TaxID=3914 RepID=A0A0L9TWR8_PHAAN|nr:hypothetical protein LR48_Vigan02g117300 [Vigna angularis]